MEEEFTTIRIRVSTKERLEKFGTFGDNFDEALAKALEQAEKCKK